MDVYADVRREGFEVRLIEVDSGGPWCGSGSLLLHWLDDSEILTPSLTSGPAKTVVRIVEEEAKTVDFKTMLGIGHANIIADELK